MCTHNICFLRRNQQFLVEKSYGLILCNSLCHIVIDGLVFLFFFVFVFSVTGIYTCTVFDLITALCA